MTSESPVPTRPADQAWAGEVGRAWIRREAQIDAQLEPFGRAALERLAPSAGEVALDIGCGSGQTLLELATRVGAQGRVVGVDTSPQMIERARERVRGLAQVALELADAQTAAFGVRFDVVFSRFGVMFFRDSLAAFHNIARAMRPHGRLAFVCWQPLSKNDWAELPLRALTAALPSLPPPLLEDDRPGPFYFSNRERVRALLAGAGFDEVAVEPLERPLHFGAAATVAEAVEYALEIGPAARLLAGAAPDQRDRARAALADALRPFATDRGVWLDAAVDVVSARRTEAK